MAISIKNIPEGILEEARKAVYEVLLREKAYEMEVTDPSENTDKLDVISLKQFNCYTFLRN